MRLEDFDYNLPNELIAQEPSVPRDSSRMMVIKGREIQHKKFHDVLDYLKKDDVLVLNNSKVLPNLLSGKKSSGSPAEIVIEEKEGALYRARVRTRSPRINTVLEFPDGLRAVIKDVKKDLFWLEFNKEPEDVLSQHGKLPVPFYVKKPLQDQELYQTEFASYSGSLAAPTSGLHFTESLLDEITKKGVKIVYVTLHISFGTFSDIRGAIENHKMDPESFSISAETADVINKRKKRLIVCGTTSFKALESASDENGIVKECSLLSDIFIYPGYEFKIKPDMMITNFHLPKSTLILFVSAYFGKDIVLNAYREAVKEKYRFFSLGDATLFIRNAGDD